MAEFGMTLFSIPKAEAHSKKEKKRNNFFIWISIRSNSKYSSLSTLTDSFCIESQSE